MSYTIHNSEVIDARIESDLKIIKSLLINEFGNKIVSLVLIGGFPRGEGSVLIEKEFIRPLIDYDVVVVVEEKINNVKLRKCSEEIIEKIGLKGKNFHIDLITMLGNSIKKLPFTQFNYDFKYAGKVFHGDKNILSLIPEFDVRKMPLETARFLLFNRMINFIYTFSYDFIDKRPPTNEESLLLKYQCLKNILDAGTALLILHGEYSPSYRERNRRFKKLFSDKEDWVKFHQKSTNFKLDPINNKINMDPVDMWFKTKEIYEKMFCLFINQMYKKEFNDWIEFVEFYLKQNRWKLIKLNIFQRIRKLKNKYIPSISKDVIELAEILIIFSLHEAYINEGYLEKAMCMLNFYPDTDLHEDKWEQLRVKVDKNWHGGD